MTPRIMVYVPNGRMVPASLRSITALDTADFEASIWLDREMNNPAAAHHGDQTGSLLHRDWFDRHADKLERARKLALAYNVDALLTIEDDIIVPPDALVKLWNTPGDVVYGLTVWRNPPHKWSATLEMEWDKYVLTVDDHPQRRQTAWDGVIETLGCGFFCTLIRRPVLEALTFRRINEGAADWGLALDARDAGFRQVTNTGVVCGHVDGDCVFYPDPITGWRKEVLNA